MTELKDMKLSGAGGPLELTTVRFPDIRGGICEDCGVLDNNQPSEVQYKLCKHYKDRDMRCSFCKENADHDEVIRMSTLVVKQDPYSPNHLVTLCGSYECTRKFEAKYHLAPR